MRRKGLVTLALTVGLVLAGSFSSFADEEVVEGNKVRYIQNDGIYAISEWVDAGQEVVEGDKVRYIKNDGTYAINEFIEWPNGTMIYFDNSGYTDIYEWMYKDERGWTQASDGWKYRIDEDTYLTNDWRKAGNNWYYLGADGYQLLNQWHRDDDGKWYYLSQDGYMLTDTTTPDGYTVNADGCWTVNGVVQVQ